MKPAKSRFSVQTKMLFVIGAGLLGFSVYFSVNFFILKNHRESLEKVVTIQMPTLELTEKIGNGFEVLSGSGNQVVLNQNFGEISKVEKSNKMIVDGFQKWVSGSLPYFKDAEILQKKYVATYDKLNELIQKVVAGVTTLKQVRPDYEAAVADMVAIQTSVHDLKGRINEDLQSAVSSANLLTRTAMIIGFFILFCGLIMTGLLLIVMVNINKSLIGANDTLQSTSHRLLEMVDEAQISASHLRDTAKQQASSSTETVVSMEQMKRLLAQTSRASGIAVDLSEASFQEANIGKDVVHSMTQAMAEIERSNTELEDVNQTVRLIRDRTNVINEIVFKTQMLSFNANIEAARAGQNGLGFAVVANEMGSLADMSGKAAQQINELLDKSTEKVEVTVVRTKEKIAKANELSAKCYEFFKVLTDRSGELRKMVDSISSAATEQNSGVNNVVNAMNDLNSTVVESDRMAASISTLANGLKGHATSLASAVNSLATLLGGTGHSKSHEDKNRSNDINDHSFVKPLKKSA